MTNTTIETYTFAQFRACLEAALVCTAKDPTRAHITNIEVNEAHMHATDGHRLLRVGRFEIDPAKQTKPRHRRPRIYIPRADAEWFLKAYSAKTAGDFPGLVTITNGAVAYNGEVLRKWKPVDVDFPLVDQVIPATQKNAPPCPTIGLCVKYLADMGKIGKSIDVTDAVLLGNRVESNLAPVCWYMQGDDLAALYVLMPVRI